MAWVRKSPGHYYLEMTIAPRWKGDTCYIIGAGPSLIGFDFERLRGRRAIVVNRMFRLCPFADVLYFCDLSWWRADGVEAMATFTGDAIYTTAQVEQLPAHYSSPLIQQIKNTGRLGLELRPVGVKHGTNSGYQAMNLAFHFGVKRIVLLGFDMTVGDQVTHAHGGYGRGHHECRHILEERMLPHFEYIAQPLADAGVEVLNASPTSLLSLWPRIPLDSVPI